MQTLNIFFCCNQTGFLNTSECSIVENILYNNNWEYSNEYGTMLGICKVACKTGKSGDKKE